MAQVPGHEVSGKWFIPLLFLAIVVFSALMGFGTYWIAQATTPFFKARFERQQAEARAQRAAPARP